MYLLASGGRVHAAETGRNRLGGWEFAPTAAPGKTAYFKPKIGRPPRSRGEASLPFSDGPPLSARAA